MEFVVIIGFTIFLFILCKVYHNCILRREERQKQSVITMFIFGTENYNKLCSALIIPNVGIKAIKYWLLPIYKVEITYDGE